MSVFLAEFIGTTFLVLLGNGVVANVVLTDTKGQNSGWMVIATAWALAVFVGVVIAGPYSGAHLNPAVSFALAINNQLSWSLFPVYVLAQILGAMFGAFLVWGFYKDHFDRTENPDLKRACFCTAPAIRKPISNLLSESIGAFVLVFVIFHFTGAELTDAKVPIGLGSVGALPVALLVWVVGLSLGGTTGYAINPARDLGPRLVHSILPIGNKQGSDWGYAWIPILGPILGALLAVCLLYIVSF